MAENNTADHKEIYRKRNADLLNKIKSSNTEDEKKQWITLFVWCNIAYFYKKSNLYNVLVDKELDVGVDFENCSSEKWLGDCTDALNVKKIFERLIKRKTGVDKYGEDNSIYYASKIILFQEVHDIDVENIHENWMKSERGKNGENSQKAEADKYLDLICETVRPLLAGTNIEYRERVLEDPGVISGRKEEDSARRNNKNLPSVSSIDEGEAEENRGDDKELIDPNSEVSFSVAEEETDLYKNLKEYIDYYNRISDLEFVKSIISDNLYPGLRITKADDEAAKEEKIRQISRLYACKSSNPERPPAEKLVLYEIERLNSEDPDLHTIIMRYWDEKEIILEKENMTYEEFHNNHYREYKRTDPDKLAKEMNIKSDDVIFRYKRAIQRIRDRVEMVRGYIRFTNQEIKEEFEQYK